METFIFACMNMILVCMILSCYDFIMTLYIQATSNVDKKCIPTKHSVSA